ncbi:hypothetical protein [Streptomyces sp. NPDC005784]|uniref:hypothetical protein n=1 Tax=Streptomyces sp. NPDC005784 TaxID=3364731 RepID=UPI0036A9FC36
MTGDTWYDEVRAHAEPGNESAGTTDRAVTTTDRRAPAVPQGPADTDSSWRGGQPTGRSAVLGATSS